MIQFGLSINSLYSCTIIYVSNWQKDRFKFNFLYQNIFHLLWLLVNLSLSTLKPTTYMGLTHLIQTIHYNIQLILRCDGLKLSKFHLKFKFFACLISRSWINLLPNPLGQYSSFLETIQSLFICNIFVFFSINFSSSYV